MLDDEFKLLPRARRTPRYCFLSYGVRNPRRRQYRASSSSSKPGWKGLIHTGGPSTPLDSVHPTSARVLCTLSAPSLKVCTGDQVRPSASSLHSVMPITPLPPISRINSPTFMVVATLQVVATISSSRSRPVNRSRWGLTPFCMNLMFIHPPCGSGGWRLDGGR